MSADFKKGMIDENKYWNYVKSELKCELSNEEIYKALRDSYTVNDEVVSIVQQTRNMGIKTCLCSNNFETRIRELDEKFNFLQDFDVKIFSYKYGILKPDSKIFQALIDETGVEPSSIAYSDDLESNLAVPKSLGITSFVFENINHFKQELSNLGVNY
jgi:putative hydrolase of the HAD superfamily